MPDRTLNERHKNSKVFFISADAGLNLRLEFKNQRDCPTVASKNTYTVAKTTED